MNRVLVIDDEHSIVTLLKEILQCLGYRVRTAQSAKEGIDIYDKEIFDLVITDIVMPDLDGHAVLRHIRKSEKPYTPVLGISGTPWLLKNGSFDAVLSKPFGVQALSDTLDKMKAVPCLTKEAS